MIELQAKGKTVKSKKRGPRKPNFVLLSSSDEEANTVKDKFWQNLGKGVAPFPCSDLYSNVKQTTRSTLPLRTYSRSEGELESDDADKSDKSDKSFVETEETRSRTTKSRQRGRPRSSHSKSSKKSAEGNVAGSLSISGHSSRALENETKCTVEGISYAFAL